MSEKINEGSYGFDLSESYFTILPDAVLEDGIYLSITDKIVYAVLRKYTHKDNMTAFPSQNTMCQMLNITRPTLIKSIEKLEELGLVSVKRSLKNNSKENDVNVYTIQKLPQFIYDSAKLCRDISNKKQVEELKATLHKQHKSKGKAKTEVKKENNIDELILKAEKIATSLGKDYIFSAKENNLIKEIAEDILTIKEGNMEMKAKKIDSYLKGFIIFCKKNKRKPNTDEMNAIDGVLAVTEPSIVVKAIKEAHKNKINVTSDDFLSSIMEIEQKELKNKEFWQKKNYTGKPSNQSNYQKKSLDDVKSASVSDYSNDEDDELYNEMLRNA